MLVLFATTLLPVVYLYPGAFLDSLGKSSCLVYSPHHLLKALISKFGHISLPYSSSRMTFPSSFHHIAESMTMPVESPFFIPGGRPALASSGGSTFNVNRITFSRIANEPGAELPWREMASTEIFVMRVLNPLFCWYQVSLGDLTIPSAIEERRVRIFSIKKEKGGDSSYRYQTCDIHRRLDRSFCCSLQSRKLQSTRQCETAIPCHDGAGCGYCWTQGKPCCTVSNLGSYLSRYVLLNDCGCGKIGSWSYTYVFIAHLE